MTEIFNMMAAAMGDAYEEPYESTQAKGTLPQHLRRVASRDYAGVNEGFWILRDGADYIEALERHVGAERSGREAVEAIRDGNNEYFDKMDTIRARHLRSLMAAVDPIPHDTRSAEDMLREVRRLLSEDGQAAFVAMQSNVETKAEELSLQCSALTDRLARLCNVAEQSLRQPHPFDDSINIPDQRRALRFEIAQGRELIAKIEATYPSCTDADLVGAPQEQRLQHSPTDGITGANSARALES